MNYVNKMGKLQYSAMEINLWRSSLHHEGKKVRYSPGNTRKHKERECCMCGDVGFQELLFKCHRCHHRSQHLYCSRLYSHQLGLDCVNIVCDWCLDFQAKEKSQRHKSRVELQEMETKKVKKVADSEIVPRSASTSTRKQPASETMEKPRKVNAKPESLKLHVKFGGSKKKEFGYGNKNQPSSLLQDCKETTELYRNVPRTISTQKCASKAGFRRRYKLLSDVLHS